MFWRPPWIHDRRGRERCPKLTPWAESLMNEVDDLLYAKCLPECHGSVWWHTFDSMNEWFSETFEHVFVPAVSCLFYFWSQYSNEKQTGQRSAAIRSADWCSGCNTTSGCSRFSTHHAPLPVTTIYATFPGKSVLLRGLFAMIIMEPIKGYIPFGLPPISTETPLGDSLSLHIFELDDGRWWRWLSLKPRVRKYRA